MDSSSDHIEFYRSLIQGVETVYDAITELFGENSVEDGLFAVRSSLLHQFSILASAMHQLNTLDYLANTEIMNETFEPELNTANYRTKDYENRALKQIAKNITSLETYLEKIIDVNEEIIEICLEADYFVQELENSYYENIILSLTFYLQEIKSRILQPAGTIIDAEIKGSRKLTHLIDTHYNGDEITLEAIARMCEVMSWGLETPPGWHVIQNETNELTGDLQKKIGNLKAITTFYNP